MTFGNGGSSILDAQSCFQCEGVNLSTMDLNASFTSPSTANVSVTVVLQRGWRALTEGVLGMVERGR